jgi:hypothetical protein
MKAATVVHSARNRTEAAIAAVPGEGSFDVPPFGYHHELESQQPTHPTQQVLGSALRDAGNTIQLTRVELGLPAAQAVISGRGYKPALGMLSPGSSIFANDVGRPPNVGPRRGQAAEVAHPSCAPPPVVAVRADCARQSERLPLANFASALLNPCRVPRVSRSNLRMEDLAVSAEPNCSGPNPHRTCADTLQCNDFQRITPRPFQPVPPCRDPPSLKMTS